MSESYKIEKKNSVSRAIVLETTHSDHIAYLGEAQLPSQ